jgi:hypothetical protein
VPDLLPDLRRLRANFDVRERVRLGRPALIKSFLQRANIRMPEKLWKSSEYLTTHRSKALITRLLPKRRNTLRLNVLRTEGDGMPPHRKLDRSRVYLYAGVLRKRVRVKKSPIASGATLFTRIR